MKLLLICCSHLRTCPNPFACKARLFWLHCRSKKSQYSPNCIASNITINNIYALSETLYSTDNVQPDDNRYPNTPLNSPFCIPSHQKEKTTKPEKENKSAICNQNNRLMKQTHDKFQINLQGFFLLNN